MKAIKIDKAGEPTILKLGDYPLPKINSDEVLIEQEYAGVNYGDIIRRKRGLFEQGTLFTPGFEGYGKVVNVGKDVRKFSVGDQVIYLDKEAGGYAEYVCVNRKNIYKISSNNKVPKEVLAGMLCTTSVMVQNS